jgi:nucleoside-diphosphate-sugar epimerase
MRGVNGNGEENTGYRPKIDMKTGLRRVYEWILENKDKIEACVKL